MTDERTHPTSWKLSIYDIANGEGIATVTLRSGVQFVGTVDKRLSSGDVLFLRTLATGGWHTIDYTEIAAVTGEPKNRDW